MLRIVLNIVFDVQSLKHLWVKEVGFHSAMTGTFQSDTGGTSIPLLSRNQRCSKNGIKSAVKFKYKSDLRIMIKAKES